MNVREAEKILSQVSSCDYEKDQADGFLECNESYKPLVDALDKLRNPCGNFSNIMEIARHALAHYSINILGLGEEEK